MTLTERLERLKLRFHPDPVVREAVRERARRAQERARNALLTEQLAAELRQQAARDAAAAATLERARAEVAAARVPDVVPDRAAAIAVERGRAGEALPDRTWDALHASAGVQTKEQSRRDAERILAVAGIRPETLVSAAVAPSLVEAGVREWQQLGRVVDVDQVVGYADRASGERPVARIVITASALDALAFVQMRGTEDETMAIAVGPARVTSRAAGRITHLRGVLSNAAARLEAEQPPRHLTVVLAFGHGEDVEELRVRSVVPRGVGVERVRPPSAPSWCHEAQRREQDMIRRAADRSGGRGRGMKL